MPSNPLDDLLATANAETQWYTRVGIAPSFEADIQRAEEDLELIREYVDLKIRWNNIINKDHRRNSTLKQRLEELTSDMINLGEPL